MTRKMSRKSIEEKSPLPALRRVLLKIQYRQVGPVIGLICKIHELVTLLKVFFVFNIYSS